MAEKKLDQLYPGNQLPINNKTQEKNIKKLDIKGGVTQRKKTIGRRLADIFIGKDVVDVRSFLIYDVVVPATKNVVVDILDGFRDSIELALFGTSRGRINRPRYGQNNNSPIVSYAQYWNQNNKQTTVTTQNSGSRSSPKDLIFANNAEASEVLDNLCNAIEQYGAVSVADLNEMLSLPGSFTDVDWGWTNLAGASVRAVRGGYLLDLPRTMLLK